nr:L1_beta_lactamase [uncultured bacterium]
MVRRFVSLCIGLSVVQGMLPGLAVVLAAPLVWNESAAQGRSVPSNWTEKVKPYQVMGNIYYVGTLDLSSFLITSPEGHVLIDTGVEENAVAVLDNIRTLGFSVKDIRVILTTQAHYDHVGAHARLKNESGARVLVAAGDAPLVAGGGEGDYLFGPEYHFPPTEVDATVKDGEVVKVGPIALTAHLTPGHTKGTTTWTATVRDSAGQDRKVVFLGSTTVNTGTKLVKNEKYPAIEADYKHAFEVEKALPCEVFLAAHASAFGGPEKTAAAAAKGDAVFVDPQGCRAAIERSEKAFLAELEKQRTGG